MSKRSAPESSDCNQVAAANPCRGSESAALAPALVTQLGERSLSDVVRQRHPEAKPARPCVPDRATLCITRGKVHLLHQRRYSPPREMTPAFAHPSHLHNLRRPSTKSYRYLIH